MSKKWHTYTSFLAGDDFHEQTAIRPVGNQMNEDKPVKQENKHGMLDDKTTFNDGVFSSSNNLHLFHFNLFFVSLEVVFSFSRYFFSKLSSS